MLLDCFIEFIKIHEVPHLKMGRFYLFVENIKGNKLIGNSKKIPSEFFLFLFRTEFSNRNKCLYNFNFNSTNRLIKYLN